MGRRVKAHKISPRKLRKASRLTESKADVRFQMVGEKKPTKTGFRVPGTSCKEFETFFEFIAPGQVTDTLVHLKKTRSYRVISGSGFVITKKPEDNTESSTVLVAGVEFIAQPGVEYSLATTSTQYLEMLVTQSAKYEARVEVVKESSTPPAVLDPHDLESLEVRDLVEKTVEYSANSRPRVTKAASQQAEIARKRGRLVSPDAPVDARTSNDPAFQVNLRPTHGSDLRGEPG